MLNKTFSPFIDLRAGMLMDYTNAVKDLPKDYPNNVCGHFFKGAVGVDYKRFSFSIGDDWGTLSGAGEYAWTIGIGYKF